MKEEIKRVVGEEGVERGGTREERGITRERREGGSLCLGEDIARIRQGR